MAAPGVSSGDAMAEMANLAKQLPPGFAIEWTGLSYQEQQSGAQAPMLLALSMLAVFLVLAAMYDSFAVPLAVMLVVPLGLIGAVTAVSIRGMANDVFFKVGLITIIGHGTSGKRDGGSKGAFAAYRDDLAGLYAGRGAADAVHRGQRRNAGGHR
ncbi:hypothetical protein E4T56_gene96, partial [Termitomyces sp. T112]